MNEVYPMSLLNRLMAIFIAPALLYGWWKTGNDSYFTFYKVLVGLSTIGLSVCLVQLLVTNAQGKTWRSPALVSLLNKYKYLVYFSWFVSVACVVYLYYRDKATVGTFVIVNLCLFITFRHFFLSGDHHDAGLSQRERPKTF